MWGLAPTAAPAIRAESGWGGRGACCEGARSEAQQPVDCLGDVWKGAATVYMIGQCGPALLNIILDDTTHFFQEPDEAWPWLETYRARTVGAKRTEHRSPGRRGKRRHTRDSTGGQHVTKPTRQQALQGKKAALQTAASLMEARSSEGALGSDQNPWTVRTLQI
ncbi:hypothetical protein NDU88_005955 [Pleurodeles waltl]|uniref:Uncharacterized protein n=1 Tax=Pleurodeles waltl TaxID=8319 RepID=A0AAV7QJQ6_PLEWA|nr:hypothetical protein NDU88_005955 [Pleurodeles waltl]